MMTKEGSTKIENSMIPGAGVIVLGRDHISHIVKRHYFLTNRLPTNRSDEKMHYVLKIFFSTSRHRSDKPSI